MRLHDPKHHRFHALQHYSYVDCGKVLSVPFVRARRATQVIHSSSLRTGYQLAVIGYSDDRRDSKKVSTASQYLHLKLHSH